MNLELSPAQQEIVAQARSLALERFAPRAAMYDREASFPFEDYADLRAAGLLALCVPEPYGGLGADFETYCLVAEQIARGNASTALTYNMHGMTMLMMGELAEAMRSARRPRATRAARARRFREVVEQGVFYGQPHSEPVEPGRRTPRSGGGPALRHAARKVDGGYVVNGRKFFVSLAGAAPLLTPRRRFWSATGRGSSARSTCRSRRTRPASPSRASGTRWGCGRPSAGTWCCRTSACPTRPRSCRRGCSGRSTSLPAPVPLPSRRRSSG